MKKTQSLTYVLLHQEEIVEDERIENEKLRIMAAAYRVTSTLFMILSYFYVSGIFQSDSKSFSILGESYWILWMILISGFIMISVAQCYKGYIGIRHPSERKYSNLIDILGSCIVPGMFTGAAVSLWKQSASGASILLGILAAVLSAGILYFLFSRIYRQYLITIREDSEERGELRARYQAYVCGGLIFCISLVSVIGFSINLNRQFVQPQSKFDKELTRLDFLIDNFNSLGLTKRSVEAVHEGMEKVPDYYYGTSWSEGTDENRDLIMLLWKNEDKSGEPIYGAHRMSSEIEGEVYEASKGWCNPSEEDPEKSEWCIPEELYHSTPSQVTNVETSSDGENTIYKVENKYMDRDEISEEVVYGLISETETYTVNRSNLIIRWESERIGIEGEEQAPFTEKLRYSLEDYNRENIHKEIEEVLKK